MKWVITDLDSAQVVDDDVDEPGAERAFLVLFLHVLHCGPPEFRMMVAVT
jgi:hypothetical protein